jgi:hypothetical protein
MQLLHEEFDIGPDNTVEVTLDRQATVLLLDPINFQHYSRGKRHTYYGGLAERSPFYVTPPRQGHWHLVIDGGPAGGPIHHA